MARAIKVAAIFIVAMLVQIHLAELLTIGQIRPDFVLVLLVFVSARYGRMAGILFGFGSGLIQDYYGSLEVLGANALAKSIVGYTLGTLNGAQTVWTPRIVNIYIYGALFGHALIYQIVMSFGLEVPLGLLTGHIFLELIISAVIVTGVRLMVPLLPSR